MKKNVGKKFTLMAMLVSLTLICWGGVIACSNDSGDEEQTTEDTKKEEEKKDPTNTSPKNKTLVENFSYTADGNLIEVCAASKLANISPTSITLTIANVAGSGDWWCSYYNGNTDWVPLKEFWDDSVSGYKKTITDSTEISYFKANGIKVGMLSGLTATVTVTYE